MKLLIASDLHGAAPAVRALAARVEAEAPDRVLLLGDLLYHGPRNDLPEGYAPKEVVPILNGWAGRVTAVRGNCEAEVDQMVLDFPCMADCALVEADGHAFYLTHGHVAGMAPARPRRRVPLGPHPRENARRPRRRAVRQPRQHVHPQGRLGELRRVRTRCVRAQGAGRRRDPARGRLEVVPCRHLEQSLISGAPSAYGPADQAPIRTLCAERRAALPQRRKRRAAQSTARRFVPSRPQP